VKVGFGSDMLGELHAFQSDEFAVRAEIVGNVEAIPSATCVAAEITGEAGVRGKHSASLPAVCRVFLAKPSSSDARG
jgi:hypothetical protein